MKEKNRIILVVEENRQQIGLAKNVLFAQGWHPVIATTLADAKRILDPLATKISGIITADEFPTKEAFVPSPNCLSLAALALKHNLPLVIVSGLLPEYREYLVDILPVLQKQLGYKFTIPLVTDGKNWQVAFEKLITEMQKISDITSDSTAELIQATLDKELNQRQGRFMIVTDQVEFGEEICSMVSAEKKFKDTYVSMHETALEDFLFFDPGYILLDHYEYNSSTNDRERLKNGLVTFRDLTNCLLPGQKLVIYSSQPDNNKNSIQLPLNPKKIATAFG